MIVDLPSASSQDVSKKLVRLRNQTGAMTLGRVLTLLIVADEADADAALESASDATRQHPSRIIALILGNKRGASRLDAQIRLGGDAGASEIVVLRLYGPLTNHGRSVVTPLLLPDSPIVVWWPAESPNDISASPIGAIAQRRITDSATDKAPRKALQRRARSYADGDTDLAWTRLTRWRGLLAAALDQAPYEPVTEATVTGSSDSPSTDLLAGWLATRLRCPVQRARTRPGQGMVSVRLERASGPIDLVRTDGSIATLTQPGQPVRRINLARISDAEALAEELRRLDPDEVYEEALVRGLSVVGASSITASRAVAEGEAPSLDEAERAGRKAQREGRRLTGSAMVDAEPAPAPSSEEEVKQASARRLDRKKAEREGESDGASRPAKGSGTAKKAAGRSSAARKSSS
ncbi:glucose-6-phosphate dehydrogenase assembly protein OpcA [Luteipulveratus flavus]|uniref:Glucose-6-phosphate dehydrogenase assembly protein OpcA n=1 Tax=Luteipulveratus flavus TaxID=3031728 RepID=A0ABT6C6T4_9MICO|nr:glucose-6-phosphate dehydrogenase assembly protein OpcA [Luteipulveratus sp. YIM 133296]MDF8264047.1 glucose-6-phosphate dehydrogenase assembly protein OpcA [Luteipulveratus sp. YIM 133296]